MDGHWAHDCLSGCSSWRRAQLSCLASRWRDSTGRCRRRRRVKTPAQLPRGSGHGAHFRQRPEGLAVTCRQRSFCLSARLIPRPLVAIESVAPIIWPLLPRSLPIPVGRSADPHGQPGGICRRFKPSRRRPSSARTSLHSVVFLSRRERFRPAGLSRRLTRASRTQSPSADRKTTYRWLTCVTVRPNRLD